MRIEYTPGPEQDEAGTVAPAHGGVSWCHLHLRPFPDLLPAPTLSNWGEAPAKDASARAITGVPRLSYDCTLGSPDPVRTPIPAPTRAPVRWADQKSARRTPEGIWLPFLLPRTNRQFAERIGSYSSPGRF